MKDIYSGNEPPFIGFGTGQLKDAAAEQAVATALDAGYRLIDTAAIYDNELEVGHAIASSNITREEILLVTKGAHDAHEHGKAEILASFEASLGKLAVDYVDYYLIHWPSNPGKRLETWHAMEQLFYRKRARHIGVSNYAVHHLQELYAGADVQPAVNQIEFHPFIYAQQRGLLDYCRENDIVVMGYSTFGGDQAWSSERLQRIAQQKGRPFQQILARWSMNHGVIPLVRSEKQSHVRANIDIDFELSDQEMAVLDGLKGDRLFRDPRVLA